MTRVLISHEAMRGDGWEQIVHILCAKGHATGSETVCAAISATLYGLSGYLVNLRENGQAFESQNEMGGGNVFLAYWGEGDEDDLRIRSAYDMTEITLKQLAQAYPKYIRVVSSSGA